MTILNSLWSIIVIIFISIFQQKVCENHNECIRRTFTDTSFVCVCNSTYCDTIQELPEHLDSNQYVIYTTTKKYHRMAQTMGTFISKFDGTPDIIIGRHKTYQSIMGFGGALTDASGINIASLPPAAQDLLMKQYFGDDGIQYTIIRVPIGGTDFSTRPYTLDDTPNDVNLTDFKLAEEDLKYKIPYIKQAIELSKTYRIKLMGVSWSAPTYMKDTQDIRGESILLPQYYQTYANYFIKFLQGYKAHGLDFENLSGQNEPALSFTPVLSNYNGMAWFPRSLAKFIANNLGPTLAENGFGNVKILILDDQRPFAFKWVREYLENKKAAEYASGVGIHWYYDASSSTQDLIDVHTLPGFENKFILYTEACNIAINKTQGLVLDSWTNADAYLSNIIEGLNYWSEGWVDWNLVLNSEGGPNWSNMLVYAPIIVNATGEEFYKCPMFYALAHASKFLVPGSVRIDLTNHNDNIKVTAFQTPNNQTVIILMNSYGTVLNPVLKDIDRNVFINLKLEPYSMVTVVY